MIPIDEQPYPLPDGWQWVKLGNVCNFERGITFPAPAKEYVSTLKNIPCIRTANVQEELDTENLIYVDKSYLKNNPAKLLLKGDIVISSANSRELVGKSCYIKVIPIEMTFGGFVLVVRTLDCFNKYMFYFLRCEFLLGKFLSKSTQTTNIANINVTTFSNYLIPLPPLDEQQRIVALLDELFADLDEAKALAQAVVDGSKLRRAAILHKAFTGELSRLWREEHGTTLDSWQRCLFGDVCQINPPKISTRDLSDDLEVSFVPMAAVSEVRGEITAPQRKPLREVKSGFTNFAEGDVLFAKITPCMENGKAALVGELVNHIGYGSTEFFVLRCSEKIFNRFVYHLVRWQIFRNEAKSVMAGAVGQQRVPKRFLTGYQINLPPPEEQKEIVRLLDDLLGREQRTKDHALKTIDHVELIKKSILARAFRGELGINKNLRAI